MAFHWNNLWLFHGLIFLICTNKLLSVSPLTCKNGDCQCATPGTTVPEKFVCDGEPDCSDGSDELNCANRTCLASEHKCGNGRCLKKAWICDNYADCLDGSDEKQSLCNFTTCAPDQFRCYNGICIAGSFKCDRDTDCLGGEDEKDCVYPVSCSSAFFQCKNKKCVDKSFKCDGEDDCGDNSDETDCGTTCSSNSFTCKSGKCIPQNLKCNGKNDCSDGSDEVSCPTASPPTCASDEFFCDGECKLEFLKCDGEADCSDGTDELGCDGIKCASSKDLCDDGKSCIMKYKFCNGRKDCADGSDEKDSRCSHATTVAPTTEFSCGTSEYKCRDASKCISKTKTCDNNRDCPGGDDEMSCLVNECEKDNGNCSHICHDTNRSYYCSCKHGFEIMNDSKTCKDVNECKTVGKCSQVCTNTEGSYKCSCTSGYVLSPNGRNCIPSSGTKAKLLVAVGLDVRSVDHDGSRMKYLVDKNTKNAVAVDIYHKRKMIFWADSFLGKIFSSILGSKDVPSMVLATGCTLKDLAVDWIAEKLYWLTVSSQRSTIYVSEFNGSNQKSVHTVEDDIHSIAVDPLGGYLYWTNLVSQKISRAYMNGENREDVITTFLIAPTGLTIDYPNKRLFWLDSKMYVIESSDLDGKNRHRIQLYDPQHLFDIAVFGDNVYWTDPISKTVSTANKFTGKNKTVLISSENITSFVPKGISIHHHLSQPSVTNPCRNNGGCSHLCLIVPNGFKCACPESGVLLPDRKNCKMPAKPTTTPQDSTSATGIKTEESLRTISEDTVIPTDPTNGNAVAHSKSKGSGMTSLIIGIIIAAVLILLVLIIVIVWYRRKKNARKMEVHYSSEAPTVKILPFDAKNPTQSKKIVDRDAYFKFANQNFKEFDADEDEDEDVDSIGEKHPVFKTFKHQDEQGLISGGNMV